MESDIQSRNAHHKTQPALKLVGTNPPPSLRGKASGMVTTFDLLWLFAGQSSSLPSCNLLNYIQRVICLSCDLQGISASVQTEDLAMSLQVTPGLLWTAGTILPVVCTSVVVTRFVVRKAQHAKIGWDDWLLVPALVSRSRSSLCHANAEKYEILILGMAAAILAGTFQTWEMGYTDSFSRNRATVARISNTATSTRVHKLDCCHISADCCSKGDGPPLAKPISILT